MNHVSKSNGVHEGGASSPFELLASLECARVTLWSDPATGLRAILAIDDTTLGPAVGGIRTRAYPSFAAAVQDAARLARAMTIKTALGGVDAGGAKIVVIANPGHPGLDRAAAFERLGEFLAELGGLVRTGGDLGTTAADLASAARRCEYVNTTPDDLSAATARGLLGCIAACVEVADRGNDRGDDLGIAGLRVAVQGCGAIGGAVARALAAAGARVLVADLDPDLAARTAAAIAGSVVDPGDILTCDADIVCPCAIGGAITADVAGRVSAWAVCGAANNVLADPAAERRLRERDVLFVPDVLASAGAVVHGVARRVMDVDDTGPLIDALGATARAILLASRDSGELATDVARARAYARIGRVRLSLPRPPADTPRR